MIIKPCNWRIFAVIMSRINDVAIYDVCTNIGVSRFIPASGIPLPDFIIDFMCNKSFEKPYGDIIVFLEYPPELFGGESHV